MPANSAKSERAILRPIEVCAGSAPIATANEKQEGADLRCPSRLRGRRYRNHGLEMSIGFRVGLLLISNRGFPPAPRAEREGVFYRVVRRASPVDALLEFIFKRRNSGGLDMLGDPGKPDNLAGKARTRSSPVVLARATPFSVAVSACDEEQAAGFVAFSGHSSACRRNEAFRHLLILRFEIQAFRVARLSGG
jgi:hypothetical protein